MADVPLPPAGWTDRPGDWPGVFLAGARDVAAPGDLRAWVVRFRAWFPGGRSEFIQWVFDGGRGEARRVRLELRRRAGAEGIERVELFAASPPPTLDELAAIERFNERMETEKRTLAGANDA